MKRLFSANLNRQGPAPTPETPKIPTFEGDPVDFSDK